MSNDKEVSEEDKVIQANEETQEVVAADNEVEKISDTVQAEDGVVVQATEESQEVVAAVNEVEKISDSGHTEEDKVGQATEKTQEVMAEDIEADNVSESEPTEQDKLVSATEETQEVVVVDTIAEKVSDVEHPDQDAEEEQDEAIDFSNFSKPELLAALKSLLESTKYNKIEPQINEIKSHFEEIFNKEKETALDEFVNNGGTNEDFEYRPSEEDRSIFAGLNEFREKKSEFYKEQERNKEKNLIAKNLILDRLREIVDGEETTHSINTIKTIQEEWKKIGPVPAAQNRNLWASFNALMDRFYDNRSIYFELKELDRKKNLEQKKELCEKAETLASLPDLKDAIRILNDLHEEFKHMGPVPREDQESLWTRFKTASDAVYSRRKEFYDGQKESFKENLTKKEELIEKLKTEADFKGSKIKEWNAKTKEILGFQKSWEAIGPVPRENGKEINKQFWTFFKQFFQNKNHFFKELDELRQTNKIKAEELIARAEELKDQTDWQQTANQMIALQQEWKQIGPTPEKVRDALYKKFKSACDMFFDNRRNSNKQINKEFEQNLAAKEDLIKKIKQEAKADTHSESALEEYIAKFNSLGFVPRKNMKEIVAKFNEAVDEYVKNLGFSGGAKEDFLFRLNLNKLQSDPNSNRVLNKKEHGIRKQMTDLENNVTLWKNNIEFFAASKTADKLKDQFDEKIQKAEIEIEKLRKKLSILKEF